MAKAVKLADIAEQVGVSTVTVSKALSGQKGVSEEMREKIKNLAEELGYRSPSETKRQSAEKQYNIGVLIQEVYLDKYDSFYWKMYQEVNKKAVSRGCFTLLESISRESVLENQMPLLLQEKKVDGLIILGDMTKPYIEQIEKADRRRPCRNARPGHRPWHPKFPTGRRPPRGRYRQRPT